MSQPPTDRDFTLKRTKRPRWQGYRHLFVWLALSLVLAISLAVFLVLRVPREHQLFVFTATDYGSHIPPNAWAHEDHSFLLDMTTTGSDEGFSGQSKVDFERSIDSFLATANASLYRGPFGRGQQSIVVYVSALGFVDPDGEPVLVFPTQGDRRQEVSGEIFSQSSVLSVRDLLDRIATNRQVADADKVIVLDAVKFSDDWSLGISRNAFIGSVRRVWSENASKWDRCFLISSSSEGETAIASPERGGSLFGTFFAEGISGGADVNGDRYLTGEELRTFLQDSVGRWAERYRARKQSVMILQPRENTFDGLTICRVIPRAWTPSPVDVPNGSDLKKLWDEYSSVDFTQAATYRPLELAAFQRSMARLERYWLAGSFYNRGESFTSEVAIARRHLASLKRPRVVDIPFVGVRIARSGIGDAELQRARQWLREQQQVHQDPTPPHDDATILDVQPGDDSTAAEEGVPTFRAATVAVWDELLSQSPQRLTSATLTTLVRRIDPLPGREALKEASLIRMLGYGTADGNAQVGRLIGMFDIGERASNPPDLRSLPWVEPRLLKVDERSREALDSHFIPELRRDEGYGRSVEAVAQDYRNLSALGSEISAVINGFDRLCASYRWIGELSLELGWPIDGWDAETHTTALAAVDEFFVKEKDPADVWGDPPTAAPDPLPPFLRFAERQSRGESGVTARNMAVYEVLLRTPLPFAGRETIRRKLLSGYGGGVAPHLSIVGVTDEQTTADESEPGDTDRVADAPSVESVAVAGRYPFLGQTLSSLQESHAIRERIRQAWELASDDKVSPLRRANLARLVASVVLTPEMQILQNNAVDQHFSESQQAYRLFQAERIRRDFWGDLGSDRFFFAEALESLGETDEELLAAAETWLPIQGVSQTVDRQRFSETGDSKPEAGFRWQGAKPPVPAGTAYLSSGKGSLALATLMGNDDPLFSLSAIGTARATAFFRGHVRSAEASLIERRPDHVTQWTAPLLPVELEVRPPAPRPVDLVFVIDSSASMTAADIRRESGEAKRIHVAMEQMDRAWDVLKKTSEDGIRLRVGFVLLGHRSYWERRTDDEGRVSYVHSGNLDIPPGDDVEAFDLSPLRDWDRSWQDVLIRLKPRGETPLYFAMDRAAKMLNAGDADEKLMVVLTDGADQVARTLNPKLRNKLQNASDIPMGEEIECLIFSVGKPSEDLALASRRWKNTRITRFATDGFLPSLEQLILDSKPRLVLRSGGRAESHSFGDTIRLSDFENRTLELAVLDVSASVEMSTGPLRLEGGQRVVYRVDDRRGELVPVIPPDLDGFEKAGASNGPYESFVRARRAGDRLRIDVAFRDPNAAEGQVWRSPPPSIRARLWPVDGSDPVRSTSDRLFLDRTIGSGFVVPFLRFEATDWLDGDAAYVEVLYSDREVESTSACESGPEQSGDVRVACDRVATERGSGGRIVEQHEGETDSWEPLQLAIVPQPKSLSRRFFREERRVETEFIFDENVLPFDWRYGWQPTDDWYSTGRMRVNTTAR